MQPEAFISELDKLGAVAAWAAAGGVSLLVLYVIIKQFLYICRPNEVLIFSGRKRTLADGSTVGFRPIFGGRAWRIPLLERVDRIDMTIIPIEIKVTQAYSKGGIPLAVRAIANVKISSNPRHILNAIERFLGQQRAEIRQVAQETLEGTLRGVLAQLTPEQVNEDRLRFAESLAEDVEDDFEKLGLHLDTLKVQHVSDDVQYLDSIGRAQIANVIKEAEIAESNAKNEANKRSAEAKARGEIARKDAERFIVVKRNDMRRIAADFEAEAESELRRAQAAGEQARAEAEQTLQEVRQRLEQIRLKVEVMLPADAQRRAQELMAKGEAATTEENGKALALSLQMLAEAWAEAGENAKDIFLIQQLETVMSTVVNKLSALRVGEVHIIDPGDGSALPNYVAGFPAMVTSILETLRSTTGVDITRILSPEDSSNGAAAAGTTPPAMQ